MGTGARTPYYDLVTSLNARLAPLGRALAELRWLATAHAGSVLPGGRPFTPDAVLLGWTGAYAGLFAGTRGYRYLLLANADSLRSQIADADADGRTAAFAAAQRLTPGGTGSRPH